MIKLFQILFQNLSFIHLKKNFAFCSTDGTLRKEDGQALALKQESLFLEASVPPHGLSTRETILMAPSSRIFLFFFLRFLSSGFFCLTSFLFFFVMLQPPPPSLLSFPFRNKKVCPFPSCNASVFFLNSVLDTFCLPFASTSLSANHNTALGFRSILFVH